MSLSKSETRNAPLLQVRIDTLVVLLVLTLSAVARFAALASAPLNDAEAGNAIAAWHIVAPDRAFSAGRIDTPLATMAAALAFGLTGGLGEGAARFFPALASLGLLLLPLLLRRRFDEPVWLLSLLFMAGSAFGHVSGLSLNGAGAAALALGLAFWLCLRALDSSQAQDWVLAAIALALALISEASAYLGVLAMALGLVFVWSTDVEGAFQARFREHWPRLPWPLMGLGAALTFALLGTGFFAVPGMLGESAAMLSAFVRGWWTPSGSSHLGLLLLVYEPLLLAFGTMGALRYAQSENSLYRFLAGWGFAAIALSVVYIGARPSYGVLTLLPLSFLAAMWLVDLFAREDDASPAIVVGLAAGALALLAMAWVALAMYLRLPQILPLNLFGQNLEAPLDLYRALTWLLVLAAGIGMAGFTWGWLATGKGLAAAGLILAALLGFSAASLGHERRSSAFEAIHEAPAGDSLRLLVASVEEIGDLSVGDERSAVISVQAPDDGALAWALRGQFNVSFVDALAGDVDSPLVLIASPVESPLPPEDVLPALGANYVGQDFIVTQRWRPNALNWEQRLRWLLYRETVGLPTAQWAVLWLRDDIYTLAVSE